MTAQQKNTPEEEWRLISRGRYEVSNLGRIRRATNGTGTYAGRILGYCNKERTAYPRIHLSFGSRSKHSYESIHRLIAEAFLGPCPEGLQVNHKDGNRRNNRLDNLEYVTRKGNAEHAISNGLYRIGERHWKAKISEKQVRFIRERTDLTVKQIASKLGLTANHVYMIRERRIWRMI